MRGGSPHPLRFCHCSYQYHADVHIAEPRTAVVEGTAAQASSSDGTHATPRARHLSCNCHNKHHHPHHSTGHSIETNPLEHAAHSHPSSGMEHLDDDHIGRSIMWFHHHGRRRRFGLVRRTQLIQTSTLSFWTSRGPLRSLCPISKRFRGSPLTGVNAEFMLVLTADTGLLSKVRLASGRSICFGNTTPAYACFIRASAIVSSLDSI